MTIPPPSFRSPASHPRTCRTCFGTGWKPGTPIVETVNGEPYSYDTWMPCDAHWSNDAGHDPYYDDVAP